MGERLVRSHHIYLDTSQRDPNDSPSFFSLEIPNNTIWLDDPASQRMKISLLNFCCDCDWFEVSQVNNSFSLVNDATNAATLVSIPPGNYTFQKLAQVITLQCPDGGVCQWMRETNMLMFQFAESHTIHFAGSSWLLLGFSETDDGLSGVSLMSTRPMQARTNNMLYIRLKDVILANDCLNLDNHGSPHAKPSDILCTVPVNAAPFQSIFYDNSVYGRDMGLWLSNPKLNSITVEITDKQGRPIEYLSDWTAQFLVEILNMEDDMLVDTVHSLKSIDSTLKRLLFLKFI